MDIIGRSYILITSRSERLNYFFTRVTKICDLHEGWVIAVSNGSDALCVFLSVRRIRTFGDSERSPFSGTKWVTEFPKLLYPGSCNGAAEEQLRNDLPLAIWLMLSKCLWRLLKLSTIITLFLSPVMASSSNWFILGPMPTATRWIFVTFGGNKHETFQIMWDFTQTGWG